LHGKSEGEVQTDLVKL